MKAERTPAQQKAYRLNRLYVIHLVGCPTCGVPVGHNCKRKNGKYRHALHCARYAARRQRDKEDAAS
ncbi:hypothetical protein D3C81_441900 [compost metagenome]